jgi:anti-sigma-K factor RskA
VNRCSSHGELVGGYVLGALEPDEMEEMRQHAAGCPTCGPETRRMAALPGLLDTVKPGDVPPPAASPEVEEAILDRFARERQPAAAARRRRRVRRRAVAAALAAVAVLALAVLLLPFGDGSERTSYATARLAALDSGSSARATAYVNAVPAGTRVSLGARGLGGRGAVYEVWCVRTNGEWVSGGTFRSSANGRARAELTAAVKPGDYHEIVVTRGARSPDGAEGRTPVLRGKLRY